MVETSDLLGFLDAAEEKMHKDPRMDDVSDIPFDAKRLNLRLLLADLHDGAGLIRRGDYSWHVMSWDQLLAAW